MRSTLMLSATFVYLKVKKDTKETLGLFLAALEERIEREREGEKERERQTGRQMKSYLYLSPMFSTGSCVLLRAISM